jgi:hypothetical protein
VPLEVRYVGAQIPDVFVLGYGLHRADLYRNVPRVVEADPRVLQQDSAAYLDALYAPSSEQPEPPGGRDDPGARVAGKVRRRP